MTPSSSAGGLSPVPSSPAETPRSPGAPTAQPHFVIRLIEDNDLNAHSDLEETWGECLLCRQGVMLSALTADGKVYADSSAVCARCGAVDCWEVDGEEALLLGLPTSGLDEIEVLRRIWESGGRAVWEAWAQSDGVVFEVRNEAPPTVYVWTPSTCPLTDEAQEGWVACVVDDHELEVYPGRIERCWHWVRRRIRADRPEPENRDWVDGGFAETPEVARLAAQGSYEAWAAAQVGGGR